MLSAFAPDRRSGRACRQKSDLSGGRPAFGDSKLGSTSNGPGFAAKPDAPLNDASWEAIEEEAEVVIVTKAESDEKTNAGKAELAVKAIAAGGSQPNKDIEKKRENATARPKLGVGAIAKRLRRRENPFKSYAGYRMDTDEASVVIVQRSEDDEAPELPFYKQSELWQRKGAIRKFLKTLTGD